jgi:hypothetical protein
LSQDAHEATLFYSPDGGATWSTQVSGVPNTGAFQWTAPTTPSDNGRLAVVEVEAGHADGDVDGVLALSDRFRVSGTVGAGPAAFVTELGSPQPNPSGGFVRLGFTLARGGQAEVVVFDLKGRLVAELARGVYPAGRTELKWDGRNTDGTKAGAGLYFARLRVEGRDWNQRLVRID